MPFELHPMTYDDIPEFAILEEAAMAGWPFAMAMQLPGTQRREFVEKFTREGWQKRPDQHWIKAVDPKTGEIAGVAAWTVPKTRSGSEGEAIELPPAPAAEVATVSTTEGGSGGRTTAEAAKEKAEDGRPPVMKESARIWAEFREKFIGDQPFANLNLLVTHPKYQRKGAGTLLVKWGCDQADEQGIIAALEASRAGYHLYSSNGFEVKREVDLDLKPFGFEGVELRRAMVRQPKTKAAS